MKRTALKKKSKQNVRKIQDLIWAECRRIVIEQYGYNGMVDCYTCGAKNLQGSNKQLGHMWAKASLGAYLKYDIRLLRFQCMRCNIHLGGQGAIFYKRMLKEEGKKYMDKLEKDRNITVKSTDWYISLLEEYIKITLC